MVLLTRWTVCSLPHHSHCDGHSAAHVCEVSAWGEFGSFTFTEDVAISEHRKTGKIVAMAVAKTVKHLVSPVVIGH